MVKKRRGKYKGFERELSSVYILKEYQGKGIGRLLYKEQMDTIKTTVNLKYSKFF
ncbi:GNAT family N-acetyltransferase [Salipaludibacillus aurantiacus]|uniref:GNAT family N-acetyltransferase n=1 Tax=Salipaludibacillus aurantiacus TaxID=1601833 RepID=UPI00115F863C|nr:GNAT family N-acetyltransferase [Salipaludibacillus aurantiacus]